MTHSWFKMPVGTAQNPVLAMIARSLNTETPYIVGIFCAAADLYAAGKGREETIEILSFMFAPLDGAVTGTRVIFERLEQRGLLDTKGSIVGIEACSSNTERVRKWREKQRNNNSNVTETLHETLHETLQETVRPDQTREIRKKETPLPPKPVTVDNSASGQGGLSRMGDLVGRLGKEGFDIREHLGDEDTAELYRTYAVGLGWEMKNLYDKYNAYVANDPPRQPGMNAFLAWAKKFTKGRRA